MLRSAFKHGLGRPMAIAAMLCASAIAVPSGARAQDVATAKDAHDGFFARLSIKGPG